MQITHTLTKQDVERATKITNEPKFVAEAHQQSMRSIDHYIGSFVMPQMQGTVRKSTMEIAIFGLYYRLLAFMKTALVLSHPWNFQTLSGMSRSVIEIYIDMELIHREKIPDAVHRFNTHADALKLRAARRMTDFYSKHPELPCDQASLEVHKSFISENAAAIDDASKGLWGWNQKFQRANVPDHWGGWEFSLPKRAKELGVTFEQLVTDQYDMRNFHIHSGVAGTSFQNTETMTATCALAYPVINTCLLGATRIIGDVLRLHRVVQNFFVSLRNLEELAGYILADVKLQMRGEPSRITYEA